MPISSSEPSAQPPPAKSAWPAADEVAKLAPAGTYAIELVARHDDCGGEPRPAKEALKEPAVVPGKLSKQHGWMLNLPLPQPGSKAVVRSDLTIDPSAGFSGKRDGAVIEVKAVDVSRGRLEVSVIERRESPKACTVERSVVYKLVEGTECAWPCTLRGPVGKVECMCGN